MMAPVLAAQTLALLLLAATMHATPPPLRLREGTTLRLLARIAGWLALVGSFGLALALQRWDYALLSWIGLLTVAAAVVLAVASWQRVRIKHRHR